MLIAGESGTGKELVAHALHELSSRSEKPFVLINCAAIPETLLESELFGHERGAFTGAVRQTIGKVEAAHRGTLFLDEIGDLPQALQVKLLRFLQDQVIERIGGRHPIQIDVRIVCATNQDLAAKMTRGEFREDLVFLDKALLDDQLVEGLVGRRDGAGLLEARDIVLVHQPLLEQALQELHAVLGCESARCVRRKAGGSGPGGSVPSLTR